MILTEFPDLGWLKAQINQRFANRQAWGGGTLREQGWPTVILNATTRQVTRDNIQGPLSMFFNLHGTSHVRAESRQVKINPGDYFITNPGQAYNLEVDQSASKTETFNIHFGTHFAENAIASLSRSPEFLLDHPTERQDSSVLFHNRLHPKDEIVSRIVDAIRSLPEGNEMLLEQHLVDLLAHLLRSQHQLSKVQQKIPALRLSTREEIIKRLLASTDYIYSFYNSDISLDELARISCLSKFHFLRLFKIAFNQTPHQFITSIRIQKAKELLQMRKQNVKEVAQQVGFSDPSSFSRLFFNSVGVYPTQYI